MWAQWKSQRVGCCIHCGASELRELLSELKAKPEKQLPAGSYAVWTSIRQNAGSRPWIWLPLNKYPPACSPPLWTSINHCWIGAIKIPSFHSHVASIISPNTCHIRAWGLKAGRVPRSNQSGEAIGPPWLNPSLGGCYWRRAQVLFSLCFQGFVERDQLLFVHWCFLSNL